MTQDMIIQLLMVGGVLVIASGLLRVMPAGSMKSKPLILVVLAIGKLEKAGKWLG